MLHMTMIFIMFPPKYDISMSVFFLNMSVFNFTLKSQLKYTSIFTFILSVMSKLSLSIKIIQQRYQIQ